MSRPASSRPCLKTIMVYNTDVYSIGGVGMVRTQIYLTERQRDESGSRGFSPAALLGFQAPYPIPNEHADAWMVQPLRPDVIGSVTGKVICSDELNKPEHWRE